MQILAPTERTALGQSCHSLRQSCARLVVAWADAELALESTGEIRKIVKPDGVSHVLDERAWMGKAFASLLQPVMEQMLAETDTLLLPEEAAKLRGAEPAQGSGLLQRDFAVEMRRHMRDGSMRSSFANRAMQGGQGLRSLLRKSDFARRSRPALARQIEERGDAPAEFPGQHRLHQQVPDPDAQRP